jgi:hypothetical protein
MPRFVTFNIGDQPRADALADARRVARLGGHIGWQEVEGDTADPGVVTEALPPTEWGHYFGDEGSGLVLSWLKSRFRVVDMGMVKTHDGRAGVTPNRFVQWGIFDHVPTGIRFARTNSHAINGGFNLTGHDALDEWRRTHWWRHMAYHIGVVLEFTVRDIPVIGGGDMNRDKYEFLLNHVTYDNDFAQPTHDTGSVFDYVFHRNSSTVRWQVDDRQVTRGLGSDHDAVHVGVTLVS